MKRNVLIIGAGGVAQVVAHKCAQHNDRLGDLHIASRTVSKAQDIIDSREGGKNVAAFDVIAESMEAMGDPEGAMWVLRDAAQVVPSARRQRILGESAYRNGDLDTAKDALGKATRSSKGSVMSLPQDTLLLAQTMVDLGEAQDALKVIGEGQANFRNAPAFGNVALAIQAQAEAATGATDQAAKTLARARETMRKGKADFATVALAKAELMNGHEEAGLALLESAISADHENLRIKQMVGKALCDTGHEDKIAAVVESAATGLQNKVADARRLLRDSKVDDAVAAIEAAVREYPENTGVLLQAAQINCMALRLKKDLDQTRIERIRTYLTRLEKLLPGHDRVNMMRRYFRETQGALESSATPH